MPTWKKRRFLEANKIHSERGLLPRRGRWNMLSLAPSLSHSRLAHRGGKFNSINHIPNPRRLFSLSSARFPSLFFSDLWKEVFSFESGMAKNVFVSRQPTSIFFYFLSLSRFFGPKTGKFYVPKLIFANLTFWDRRKKRCFSAQFFPRKFPKVGKKSVPFTLVLPWTFCIEIRGAH